MNKNLLAKAALASILGAMTGPQVAMADHHDEKGKCIGANACKSKSGCATEGNACAGQNGCKGKGYTEMTKAECDKLAKKDKNIKFEVVQK
jgi:hypothetical protein